MRMDLLPDEVLLMIFEFLPINNTTGICKHVCKRWEKLVERRSLIIQAHSDISELHYGLRSLVVLGWLPSLASVLFCAPYYAPYLRSLTVHAGMPLTNQHITDLRHLSNLEHLDVFTRSQVHDARFSPVVSRLTSMVFNESVAPDLLRELAVGCQLTEIHMYGRALYYHRRHLRILLQLRAEYLRELTLRCTELTDAAYEAVGNCPNLESLRLYSCWLMTNKGALHITKLQSLRYLHLTGARLVRSQALKAFLEEVPLSVKELVLSASWFGDEHIPVLLKRELQLHTLELWKCKLTAGGAVKLALSLPCLKCYDTDLMLSPSDMNEIQAHPSLEILRCLIQKDCETSSLNNNKRINGLSPRCFRMIPADARFPRKYFRSGSEGFRGSLFYYWSVNRELVPLPSDTRPSLDDEDDMFY